MIYTYHKRCAALKKARAAQLRPMRVFRGEPVVADGNLTAYDWTDLGTMPARKAKAMKKSTPVACIKNKYYTVAWEMCYTDAPRYAEWAAKMMPLTNNQSTGGL